MQDHAYVAHKAARQRLLATTMLAGLALSPVTGARGQTATSGANGDAVDLPAISVEGSDAGPGASAVAEGYSAPPVLQSTTKIDVPTFDLPIAIQTVPEQVIADQNAVTIQEALENVSGVRSSNNNLEGYVFTIRGFRSLNVFRNGLLISDAIAQVYDTANLQSIEVLKGPASFIFGRADPGGVVNLVTKKPQDTPYYSLTEQFGSFNMWRTAWDLTGPVQVPVVADGSVSYRLTGAYQDGGQFVDFTRTRNLLLAPSITWKIGPATTLTVEAEYLSLDGRSNVGQPAVGLKEPLYPANIPAYRSFLEPNEPLDTVRSSLISYNFQHQIDNDWKITNRFLAARSTLVKDDLTTLGLDQNTSILDRSITYQKLTGTNYSANLDLTGKFHVLGVKNDILIGADYFYSFYNYILAQNGTYPINIYNPIYGSVPTANFYNIITQAWQQTADYQSFSSLARKDLGVYAQDSITLFENLHVLLGARYDLADVRGGDGDNFAQASANFGTSTAQHTGFFSPRVGLVYQPVPWLGFYGSYTRSFGQPNGIATDNSIFPPQVAVGWEGGVKAELLNRRLTATLAFFDITKSNILTSAPTADDPFARRPIGVARSQGAELDVLGKLTDELSVIASYSHIDARIIADTSGLIGNSLRSYAPDSGSVWLTYAFPKDSLLDGWTAGSGVYAVSDRWGDDENTFILPAYARLDAMAKYKFAAGGAKWSAQINLKNIANTRYIEGNDIYFNNFGPFGLLPGAPRAVTASLRVEF